MKRLPTQSEVLDLLEQQRQGLFKDGKLTAKGQALVDEETARRRQRHGWKRA